MMKSGATSVSGFCLLKQAVCGHGEMGVRGDFCGGMLGRLLGCYAARGRIDYSLPLRLGF